MTSSESVGGSVDQPSEADPIEVRHRTVAAIEQTGFLVDRELWFAEDASLCSQCHNGCYNDPPPDPPPKK
ncbi:hypothetical protein SAMN05216215_104847 [Saccharopolyspora shandongensis]|uniref:Uncharacterized protein n=1 Tax=Saccharopolyspora shandongensis TaxID=418495 RepID=A0A1H3QL76_9PSEU|nr:hypothetical protein [Saccharopolyspora shandongensis]SDZ14136.1 hypothetical protein SAMN05216215_104847 [Saccharopolyspora shandongensis]